MTLEVKNISLGVLDRDNSVQSQALVRKLSYSNTFTTIYRLKSEKMIIALMLTSLSVARERELCTFEQISVTPISPTVLILGKTIPPLMISMVEASVIFFAATTFFGVPFMGSIAILYLGLFAFLLSIIGLGLLISSISSTQQQGILGAFVLVVPYILMSGFATPVENMPSWLIPVTDLISLKYFLLLLKGVFLKDISLEIAIELIPYVRFGNHSTLFCFMDV